MTKTDAEISFRFCAGGNADLCDPDKPNVIRQTTDMPARLRRALVQRRPGVRRAPVVEVGHLQRRAGDPDSISFFHRTGLGYVSCLPYCVPIERLVATHTAIAQQETPSKAA